MKRILDWISSYFVVLAFSILAAGQVLGFRSVTEERESREAADCRRAAHIRDEQEQILVDVIAELGGDPTNPRIQEAITIVHDRYDELPAPLGCDQGGR